jgi:DNA-binding NtrC family response regulator
MMVSEIKPRILVVDDDSELREMIRNFLAYRGCYVETACDGLEGCAALERNIFDLVITDIYMPRMNGLELLETIEHNYPDLPTVTMTGFPNEDITKRVLEKGSCEFLVKPFTLQQLLTTITKCFEQSEAHKPLAKILSNN